MGATAGLGAGLPGLVALVPPLTGLTRRGVEDSGGVCGERWELPERHLLPLIEGPPPPPPASAARLAAPLARVWGSRSKGGRDVERWRTTGMVEGR